MTLKVKSTRFGEQEIDESKIIKMPEGVIGFPEKRFVLLSPEKGPFHWLQAVDNPDLAFVVADPKSCVPDYDLALSGDEFKKLGLTEGSETVILSVVTMAQNPLDITINLMGPIVLNPENMVAFQIVLEDGRYSTKHMYFQVMSSQPVGHERKQIG